MVLSRLGDLEGVLQTPRRGDSRKGALQRVGPLGVVVLGDVGAVGGQTVSASLAAKRAVPVRGTQGYLSFKDTPGGVLCGVCVLAVRPIPKRRAAEPAACGTAYLVFAPSSLTDPSPVLASSRTRSNTLDVASSWASGASPFAESTTPAAVAPAGATVASTGCAASVGGAFC